MRWITIVLVAAAVSAAGLGGFADAQTQRYVAPTQRGNGSGSSAANAAAYTQTSFWNGVQSTLAGGPVNVTFLDGNYPDVNLDLRLKGHADHRLVLQSQTKHGAVFTGGGRLQLLGSQNIAVRNFGFTGDASDQSVWIYKLVASSSGSGASRVPSKNILFEGNSFYNAPTYYGAIGVSHGSHHVTIHDNTFRRIGRDGHAHMIYSAYDGHHVKVIGNTFEDSTGDYVRFRDNYDFGEVRLNTLLSKSSAYNHTFVQMPVFNDVNPGDEFHASNYLIRDNTFTYTSTGGTARYRNVMGYRSDGYEPVGKNYLPSAADGAILTGGTVAQKRKLLLDTMGIDLSKVRVYGNTYTRHNLVFRYAAYASYGAASHGWQGEADITAAINSLYLGAGDVRSDAVLDEADIDLFLRAFAAPDEMSFLLDDEVWFGDYQAADVNGDGVVDLGDVEPMIDLFTGLVPDESLDPLRALVPEPAVAATLGLAFAGLVSRCRR